jgi:putative hemolysin
MEVRLAASETEIRRAQALRYAIFYEEMAAVADARTARLRRDEDAFDAACDHLLVYDRPTVSDGIGEELEVVGACRLLRQDGAERIGCFYSQGEFDFAPLFRRKPELRFLEIGRSCVLPGHRSRRALELLWHGIWSYVLMHDIDVMIGCGSLQGTDPEALALPLSYLHHFASAPAEWRVEARADRRIAMARLPAEAIDAVAARRTLPPLLKGYLRLGAHVGDGAVVDRQFGTTDICIILPVAAINPRYVAHYGADASRYAA